MCGGTLRVIACIDTPEVIETILTRLAARNTARICQDAADAHAAVVEDLPHPVTDPAKLADEGAPAAGWMPLADRDRFAPRSLEPPRPVGWARTFGCAQASFAQ